MKYKMTFETDFEAKHIQSIIAYNRKVEAVLNQASKDLAKRISIFELKHPTAIYKGSFYKINKGLKNKVDTILNKLHNDIKTNIQDGVVSQWDMANLAAMDSFLTRTAAGMNLSKRVWNLVNGAKDQVELYLSSGISTGKSAAGIARDIKQYLNEPDRLFRRVRQDGKLILSKAARGYHPGAGIYRSSFQNALRLTQTEINSAYRASDYVRIQNLPFVTGIEIHLSASHEIYDICDDMVGVYPKTYCFMNFHPRCICYVTTIRLSDKDSLKFMQTGKIAQNRYISKIPSRAQRWLNKNKEKILGYKQLPYFIEQNYDKSFKLLEKANVPYLQER